MPNTTHNSTRTFAYKAFQLGFRHPWIVSICIVSAILAGLLSWQFLPVEAYPELGPQNVLVITQDVGVAAQEIEQQITIPIERQLAATPGLIHSRSVSTFGLSLVTLTFAENTDIYRDRTLTLNQLEGLELMNGVHPTLGPLTGPSSEILRYVLESNTQNLMALSDIQNWIVIPALKWVPGVVDVANFGGFTKEYQIKLNPQNLYKYHIGFQAVLDAIQQNNKNSGGGRVTRGEQSYIIRGIGRINDLKDLGNTVVTSVNGAPVLLKDIGIIEFGHKIREGILGWNGNPDAVEGVVNSLRGVSQNLVLDTLHKKIAEIQESLKPLDVRITYYLDRSNLIHVTVKKVAETITTGILLVFLLLTLLLGNFTCAAIVACSIPISLATTFALMGIVGIHASMFSLGALDFGIIVDGSIVVCEIILKLREKQQGYLSQTETLSHLAKEGKAIVIASLAVMVAYAPLFVFNGNEGKLFRPMAYTVLFSLIGALLCALFVIPFLSWSYLRKSRKIRPNKLILKLSGAYKNTLLWCVSREKIVSFFIGGTFLLLGFMVSITGQDFMPSLDEGALWIQAKLPSGVSLEKGSEITAQIRNLIRAYPEVKYVATQEGRSDEGTDPLTLSNIEIPVGLIPYDKWPWGETKQQFIHKLRKDMYAHIPGISFTISQPIEDNLEDQMGGAHSPLVLRVYGNDFSTLRKTASKIVNTLKELPQSEEVMPLQEPPIPNILITPDRFKAARYGIPIQEVSNLVEYVMGDNPITQIMDNERSYDATIASPPKDLSQMSYIESMPLATPSGQLIPLSEIATITTTSGESNIAHEMGQRDIAIEIDNGSMPVTQYIKLAQSKIDSLDIDPKEFRLEWAGNVEQIRSMRIRMIIGFTLMLTLMFTLLYIEFKELMLPALVLMVLPLATLGGLVAINVRGLSLNVATIAGFIALFGVATQNGVLMINAIFSFLKRGANIKDAVLRGTQERFRPVVTTAVVATAGMIPASLSSGVGTDFQRGVATVIVGGLAPATLLTLFVLPMAYYLLEAHIKPRVRGEKQ